MVEVSRVSNGSANLFKQLQYFVDQAEPEAFYHELSSRVKSLKEGKTTILPPIDFAKQIQEHSAKLQNQKSFDTMLSNSIPSISRAQNGQHFGSLVSSIHMMNNIAKEKQERDLGKASKKSSESNIDNNKQGEELAAWQIAQEFEKQILGSLMSMMVDTVPVNKETGGGIAEEQLRSFWVRELVEDTFSEDRSIIAKSIYKKILAYRKAEAEKVVDNPVSRKRPAYPRASQDIPPKIRRQF